MKIYGSTTSPFVRRLRLLLAEQDYEFVPFNIFGKEREALKATNPTLKIPMFEDSDCPDVPRLFDSGVTFRYLNEKLGLTPLSLEQQNILSVIDACSDSLVNVMLLNRSGVDTTQDIMYLKIQRERQLASFEYLDKLAANDQFKHWNYVAMCLVVLVEWAQFRELYDFSAHSNLLKFVEESQGQIGVTETKPKE